MKAVSSNQWQVVPGVLAEREALYLTGFAAGKSCKEIARDCGVSPNTVKKAATRILAKLQAWRMTEAIANACHKGILKHLCVAFLCALVLSPMITSHDEPFTRARTSQRVRVGRARRSRRDLNVV